MISQKKSVNYFNLIRQFINIWSTFIQKEFIVYIIDEKLIKSIIYVESGRNFYAHSNSTAIGLMPIKVSSVGKVVYQDLGKKGNLSNKELFNPQ